MTETALDITGQITINNIILETMNWTLKLSLFPFSINMKELLVIQFQISNILRFFLSTCGDDLILSPPALLFSGTVQGRLSAHQGSRVQVPQDLRETVYILPV